MSLSRKEQINKIVSSYDICIIGGGATGAGVALDATLRGYKVLLIEKGDFASQTSSKSTKLVHGGVRYLEQAVRTFDWQQFKMVYKALHERKVMLQNAPHLAQPLALLTPCYTWFDRMYYGIGMWMYDRIAGSTNLKDSRGLGISQIKREVPALEIDKMKGGILYFDGQMNDARYALAILQEAARLGATILNYAEFISFTCSPESHKITQVNFKDLLSGQSFQVDVKAVVNATGPFTDQIRKMANPKINDRMKVSRGAHIVLPKEFWPGETALLIPKTDDGRVVFLIPWRDSVLVGTTDDPDDLSENPIIREEEKVYLLHYFNRFAKQKAILSDIKGSFVGLRPLLQVQLPSEINTDTKSIVRDHEVEIDHQSALVSIMGGKWTTYRLMAEDTLDLLETEVLHLSPTPCQTKNHLLFGGKKIDKNKILLLTNLSDSTKNHLLETYGSQAPAVLEDCQQFAQGLDLIHPDLPYLSGEINYLIHHEMVTSWDDILLRRWGLGLRDEKWIKFFTGIKIEAFASIK